MSDVELDPVLPPRDATALDELQVALDGEKAVSLALADGTSVVVPEQLRVVLSDVVAAMRRGQAISIISSTQSLTTQQAADILGVSRPTLIKLLESGQIPYETPGRHRRIKLTDLLAFREVRREERRAALDRMTVESQEFEALDIPAEVMAKALKDARKKLA
jgi:excisionase family DNA binding protein